MAKLAAKCQARATMCVTESVLLTVVMFSVMNQQASNTIVKGCAAESNCMNVAMALIVTNHYVAIPIMIVAESVDRAVAMFAAMDQAKFMMVDSTAAESNCKKAKLAASYQLKTARIGAITITSYLLKATIFGTKPELIAVATTVASYLAHYTAKALAAMVEPALILVAKLTTSSC